MLKVFFFIMFALIPLPINCGQRNSICVDCRKYKKEKCKISKTGYQCLVSGNLRRAYGSGIHIPPITTDLRKCIPKGMEKQAEDFDQCCFWSPELGCQAVYDSDKDIIDCDDCRDEACPCESGNAYTRDYSMVMYMFLALFTNYL